MRLIVITLLVLFSNIANANVIEVKCYSNKKLFLHLDALEAFMRNENLVISTAKYDYVVFNGDCVLKYKKKK